MNMIKGTLFFLVVLMSPLAVGIFIAIAPHILFGVSESITLAWSLFYFIIWVSTWEWMKSKG